MIQVGRQRLEAHCYPLVLYFHIKSGWLFPRVIFDELFAELFEYNRGRLDVDADTVQRLLPLVDRAPIVFKLVPLIVHQVL